MGDSRLNGLALAYIHKHSSFDANEVLKLWDATGHRRISLAFEQEKSAETEYSDA